MSYNLLNQNVNGNSDHEKHVEEYSLTVSISIFICITVILGAGSPILLLWTNVGTLDTLSIQDWLSLYLSSALLIGMELTLGIPGVKECFRNRLTKHSITGVIFVSSVITFTWFCGGIPYGRFNPLICVFVFGTCFVCLASNDYVLHVSGNSGLTPIDIALWLLIWVPLDLRWVYSFYWTGVSFMGYDYWALFYTNCILFGWLIFRDFRGFGYRLIPNWKDPLIGIGVLIPLLGIIVPLGILSGFLHWPPSETPSALDVISLWWENVLTVAITEELFYRVILFNGINHTWPSKYNWKGFVFSSIMFGLMHIPRESELEMQAIYASFAAVAGVCYASAYYFSGNNIVAAIISHSVTDTVWSFVLSG